MSNITVNKRLIPYITNNYQKYFYDIHNTKYVISETKSSYKDHNYIRLFAII